MIQLIKPNEDTMAKFKTKAEILELLEGYISDNAQEDGLFATLDENTGKLTIEDGGIDHTDEDDDNPPDSIEWTLTLKKV